jgi:hypothetical protein
VDEYEQTERQLYGKAADMGRYTTDTTAGFEAAPMGTHLGICVKITDIGTHHDEYNGKARVRNRIVIQWELPLQKMSDGKPFVISEFYTNSLSEKGNLRPMLEAWRGRAFTAEELMKFDLEKVLGAPAMIGVIHNEKGRARVSSVLKLPAGMEVPTPVNAREAFWLDEWNEERFNALSEGIRKMIMDSDEYKSRGKTQTGTAKPSDDDDDIPF